MPYNSALHYTTRHGQTFATVQCHNCKSCEDSPRKAEKAANQFLGRGWRKRRKGWICPECREFLEATTTNEESNQHE